MQVNLTTTLTSRLLLQLPYANVPEAEGIAQYAKVTAVTFLEREFAAMVFDENVNPHVLQDMLEKMCQKISTDFNAAMIGGGYPMIVGVLTCIGAADYELRLDVAYEGQAPSAAVH